jgi:hypothetical protein
VASHQLLHTATGSISYMHGTHVWQQLCKRQELCGRGAVWIIWYTMRVRHWWICHAWTSLVYVVITRVSGHGTSRVFTTRRVCHTSTCTARGHPSMCTWTALAYVVTAHHACSPLVGYAIRVHVRHVDTRVRVHHWHMEYTLYMEMCRCGFA